MEVTHIDCIVQLVERILIVLTKEITVTGTSKNSELSRKVSLTSIARFLASFRLHFTPAATRP